MLDTSRGQCESGELEMNSDRLQQGGIDSRRRRERPHGAGNFDGGHACDRESKLHCSRCRFRGRHYKRKGGDRRLIRILTAGHRAIRHVVPAVLGRWRLRGGLLMMVLRNVAVAAGAARHRVTRPCRRGKRRIQKHNRQQTGQGGESSMSIWSAVRSLHLPRKHNPNDRLAGKTCSGR
jgi:hypothetical protein